MKETNLVTMNRAAQIMVAKLDNICVPVCMKCKSGISGIPNCRPNECDLPIELIGKEGKIGVIISNLVDGKWDFFIKDKTFDVYYVFGFDKDWNEILHLWKIPKKDVMKHLGKLEFHL